VRKKEATRSRTPGRATRPFAEREGASFLVEKDNGRKKAFVLRASIGLDDREKKLLREV